MPPEKREGKNEGREMRKKWVEKFKMQYVGFLSNLCYSYILYINYGIWKTLVFYYCGVELIP